MLYSQKYSFGELIFPSANFTRLTGKVPYRSCELHSSREAIGDFVRVTKAIIIGGCGCPEDVPGQADVLREASCTKGVGFGQLNFTLYVYKNTVLANRFPLRLTSLG